MNCLFCHEDLSIVPQDELFTEFCNHKCYKSWVKREEQKEALSKGVKHDNGKKQYYAMPLEVLDGLASVFEAGEKKYEIFNCLKPFDDSDRRFWDGMMRHLRQCQSDPLAVDDDPIEGTGCLQGYQAGWNVIMRTYHAEKRKREEDAKKGS